MMSQLHDELTATKENRRLYRVSWWKAFNCKEGALPTVARRLRTSFTTLTPLISHLTHSLSLSPPPQWVDGSVILPWGTGKSVSTQDISTFQQVTLSSVTNTLVSPPPIPLGKWDGRGLGKKE